MLQLMKNEASMMPSYRLVEVQVGYGSDEKPTPERELETFEDFNLAERERKLLAGNHPGRLFAVRTVPAEVVEQPEEPAPTERSRRVYLKVRDLPVAIQRGLAAVSYARSDIEVEAAEKGSPFDAGSEGRRGFVVLVSVNPSYSGEGIGSGIYEIHRGSWGGANLFATSNPVDLDQAEHRIPPTGAVINGSTGYGGVRARVTMHPALLASLKLLSAPAEELTPEEAATMYAFGCLKGGAGRRDHMARHGAGEGTIDALVARGLLKKNAAGAVSITLAGKNTRRSSGAGEGW